MTSARIIAPCLFWIAVVGCRTTPITGRRQVLIIPESTEINLGMHAFQDVLSSEKVSTNQRQIELVNRVGQRIAEAAQRPDYQWEFQLLASPKMNAFCLPGGKVAVYEGILPICQNEAGLAVVMSHEIAHALARHGGERMSQSYVVTGVGQAIDWATMQRTTATRNRVTRAYGLASKLGVTLPYSRKHESEADHMGMFLMAAAGYDPREAPRFWERFGQAQSGEQPIEFPSTHPADARRAADLLARLPEAVALYERAPQQLGVGERVSAQLVSTVPTER